MGYGNDAPAVSVRRSRATAQPLFQQLDDQLASVRRQPQACPSTPPRLPVSPPERPERTPSPSAETDIRQSEIRHSLQSASAEAVCLARSAGLGPCGIDSAETAGKRHRPGLALRFERFIQRECRFSHRAGRCVAKQGEAHAHRGMLRLTARE